MFRLRDKIVKLLNHARQLDSAHIKWLYRRVIGYGLSLIGSAASLCGLLLSHATFGLSLSLTLGGLAVSTFGHAYAIWHTVKRDMKFRSISKEVEKLMNLRLVSHSDFRRQMESGWSALIVKLAQESLNMANLITNARLASHRGIHIASCVLLSPNPTLQMCSIGLSLIFLGLDIMRVVEASLELKENYQSSRQSEAIRSTVEHMERELVSLRRLEALIIKSAD